MKGDAKNLNSDVGNSLINPLLEKAIELAGDPIIISDANEMLVWVNKAFEQRTGFLFEDVVGRRIDAVIAFNDLDYSYKGICAANGMLSASDIWRRQLEVRHIDGGGYRAEEIITVLRDGVGGITHYVSVLHDLTSTDQVLQLERLRAKQDPLTGLAGRKQVLEAIEAGLHLAKLDGSLLALIFIDLDGFKQINDRHGHLAGDALLCAVSSRLQGVVRSTDTVGRFGGDEFVVVLPSLVRRSTAREVAGKLIDQLSQPFSLQSGCHCVGASLGLAFFPDHGSTAETLLARADAAMYTAKRRGGRQLAVSFDELEIPPRQLPAIEIPSILASIAALSRASVQDSLASD